MGESRCCLGSNRDSFATWEVTARDAWEIDFEMQVTSAALTDAVFGNRAVAYHVVGEIAPVVVDFVAVLESLEDLGF